MGDDAERRKTKRFPVRRKLAARIAEGEELVGSTRDVNAQGVFFFTAAPVPEGSHVDVVLNLPPGSIFSDLVFLRASGTAVRVEHSDDGRLGVAVVFEEVEVTHSSQAPAAK